MSKALSITKSQQRQIDAAAEMLRPWGLGWSVESGGKHLIMKVAGPKGGVWRLVIACTPRDPDNAIAFARQGAKRIINQINTRLGVYEVRA
jgi:hypothetical protein